MLASTSYTVRFLTRNDLGVLEAPASLPTAALFKNGAASGVTVTVANVSTGRYTAQWTNGAWSDGDVLQLEISTVYGATTYVSIAWDGEINSTGGGGGGLDAAGVRAAVGLAAADLDTQLAAIAGYLDTEIAAIKAVTDQFVFTVAGQVDANALSGGGSGLDAAGVRAAVGLSSANLDTQLAGINTNVDAVDTSVGSVATQATVIAGYLDTEIAAIKAKTDQFVFTIAGQVDANALSGGGTDWTESERDQIRYRLGVDGDTEEPTTNDSNLSVTLRPSVVISANTPVVDEGLAFAITQRDDFENDSDVGPIGPIRVQTDLPLLRETDPPRLRFGATQRLGTRFSATVHAIGTAYAEAVAGEADQYDIYLEIPNSELDKPAGLYGWDVEAVFDDGDVRTVVGGNMTLTASMGDNEERDPLNTP